MGMLQRLLAQTLTRLKDTNASQRVALVLGGTLVGLSLLWLTQWAATPERVPLLEQDFAAEELARVQGALEALGIDYEIKGSRAFVPASTNRQAVLARLQQDGSLPADTSTGFAALVKESDPWISQEESARRWTWALQNELQRILAQFDGVKEAFVVLNYNTQQRSFTRQAPPNSASVTVVTKSGEPVPRTLALAAAKLVAGAVAGLPVRNVQVLDAGGRTALDWDAEQDPTNALKSFRASEEQRFTDLIRRQVPDPRALVSVRVELNSIATQTQTTTPSKGVERSSETTSEQRTAARGAEAPGVQPNVGISVSAGGRDENETRETQKTEYATGTATRTESKPAGDVESVMAAIALSSSYLDAVYRSQNAGAAAPDDAALETVFQAERTRLTAQIAKLVKPPAPENVAISRYYDTLPEIAKADAANMLEQSLELATRYAPQSGLALLALIGLSMMLRLARKTDTGESFGLELGLPKEAIEAAKVAAEDVAKIRIKPHVVQAMSAASGGRPGAAGADGGAPGGPQVTTVADVVTVPVGQATATEGVLVAQEVDPAAVQTRKMLEQIGAMVDSDPETVATLLEQWVVKNEQYHDAK
jgi:flagellar biosynthesis/type III secretory pathway M-ring protein FliF/YscJ